MKEYFEKEMFVVSLKNLSDLFGIKIINTSWFNTKLTCFKRVLKNSLQVSC